MISFIDIAKTHKIITITERCHQPRRLRGPRDRVALEAQDKRLWPSAVGISTSAPINPWKPTGSSKSRPIRMLIRKSRFVQLLVMFID